ncbi:MAG TPA: MlaD family protein [Chitinophagaceae bacterium]|jgi:phospholipid/cholesterol/gamma-HCH transport system substrate-binding protein|nr:MlaD family protein [Chitinophagaceae bacterium]
MKAIQGKRAVIVGIFILVAVAIFMGALITLGKQKKTFTKGILVKAVFDNVNGLQVGNNIWFSGVKVGTVKKMELTNNARVIVDMTIDKKLRDFIHEDAKAKIGSDGLIGNKIVVLYGGTQGAPAIKANDILQVEAALSTEEMMNSLQENNKNLLAITGDFKMISRRLANGEGSVGRLLTDDSFMDQLQATAGTLQKASANIQVLSSNMADFSAKLQTEGTLANDLVSDTTIFKSLRSSVAQIQEASDNAKQLTDNLKTVSQKINDSSNTVGVLLHDQQTADNLRATIGNLQSGTQKFDEDMEALQHNFLFRGFFRKKAKREQAEQQKQTTQQKQQAPPKQVVLNQ